MIPKIAIRGREKQPNLVIEYLTKLGGNNITNWQGDDIKGFYWIDELKRIRCTDNIPEGYQFIDDWYKDNQLTKYILVEFPESQKYIGNKDCHICFEMASAVFVPEEIYNKMTNND